MRVLFTNFNPMTHCLCPGGSVFKYCDNPRAGAWKEWTLLLYLYYETYGGKAEAKIVQDMAHLTGVERLVLKAGYEFSDDNFEPEHVSFIAQKLEFRVAERLALSLFANLTSLFFCVTDPTSVRSVLSPMKKLTWLSLYFHSFMPKPAKELIRKFNGWNEIPKIVGEEVGQTLRFLALGLIHKDLDLEKKPFEPLASREIFPVLRRLHFGVSFFAELNEPDMPVVNVVQRQLKMMPVLMEVYEASIRHGGWTINRLVHELNLFQLASLDVEKALQLINWLDRCRWKSPGDRDPMNLHLARYNAFEDIHTPVGFYRGEGEPWSGHIGITDHHIWDFVNGEFENRNALPHALKYVLGMWSAAEIPLKVELHLQRPFWNIPVDTRGIRERFWNLLPPVLDSLRIHPLATDRLVSSPAGGDPFECSEDWTMFMDEFLPLCHNLTSLRIQGARDEGAPVFMLRRHAKAIYDLCKNHKLRDLDVDLGALLQPETACNVDFPLENPPQLGADIQEPRLVMQHIMWISIPGTPKESVMLDNLTRLTLRNMFIYRQIEMTWVWNIPAKLKNLERLEFIGLVWALNYDPTDGKRDKYLEELEKAMDDDDDDDDDDDNDDDDGGDDDDDYSDDEDGDKGSSTRAWCSGNLQESNKKKKKKGKWKGKDKVEKKSKENADNDDDEANDKETGTNPLQDGKEIKWFTPKDGDYDKYNLRRVPSRDSAVEAEKRKRKNKRKNQNKKKSKGKKKMAEEGIASDNVESGPSNAHGSEKHDSDLDLGGEKSGGDFGAASAPPRTQKKKNKRKASSSSKRGTIEDPKTRALVQSIETQFTKFNLGENNEITHPTPHDDGLLGWLPGKDDPTSSSSSSSQSYGSSSDSNSDSGSDSTSKSDSDDSTASTVFGADPRFEDSVNMQLRVERHRQWLIRVLLDTAARTGGKCRDIRIKGMKLNGYGHCIWNFDMEYDADLDPYDWDSEESHEYDYWDEDNRSWDSNYDAPGDSWDNWFGDEADDDDDGDSDYEDDDISEWADEWMLRSRH